MNDNKKTLSFELRPDGVAVITFDVPGEPVNTLQASFAEEFEALITKLDGDPSVKAAIIVSGKADTWIAGANIDMLKSCKTAADAEDLARMGQRGFLRLEELDKPVVAAINGSALGGGFELALACHGRVLSDEKKTVLAFPEVQLGLLPGSNGLQRLARTVGLQVALDYGLTGKNMRPVKAKKLGVVQDVVRKSALVEVAAKLALKLAEKHSSEKDEEEALAGCQGADDPRAREKPGGPQGPVQQSPGDDPQENLRSLPGHRSHHRRAGEPLPTRDSRPPRISRPATSASWS